MNFEKQTKENINHYFENINNSEIDILVELIIKHKNSSIIFLGIGKSFNVCLEFSDLLKCINFKSIVIESSKILHGDIGLIYPNDLIIVMSNSGNTEELITIVNIIKNIKNNNLILLSSKVGKLSNICKYNYTVPVKYELASCFNIIPSNSILNFNIFTNHVINNLITKLDIKKDIYIENHYSGNIGQLFKKIKDEIITIDKCCIMSSSNTIKETIISMNTCKIACAVIIDNNIVSGFITDRDIRVYLENNDDLNTTIDYIMNTNYFYLNDINMFIKDIKTTVSYIPIINHNKTLLGIYKHAL